EVTWRRKGPGRGLARAPSSPRRQGWPFAWPVLPRFGSLASGAWLGAPEEEGGAEGGQLVGIRLPFLDERVEEERVAHACEAQGQALGSDAAVQLAQPLRLLDQLDEEGFPLPVHVGQGLADLNAVADPRLIVEEGPGH